MGRSFLAMEHQIDDAHREGQHAQATGDDEERRSDFHVVVLQENSAGVYTAQHSRTEEEKPRGL